MSSLVSRSYIVVDWVVTPGFFLFLMLCLSYDWLAGYLCNTTTGNMSSTAFEHVKHVPEKH
jgi:hypothetical protein